MAEIDIKNIYDYLGQKVDEVQSRLKQKNKDEEESETQAKELAYESISQCKMILDKISLGFISSKRAKEIIASAYKELKIDDSPKASNLIRWFDCKEITKKVDGKVVKGYEIYSQKFIFK